jgi:hypothetical protein
MQQKKYWTHSFVFCQDVLVFASMMAALLLLSVYLALFSDD